jgi:hypothetical protein
MNRPAVAQSPTDPSLAAAPEDPPALTPAEFAALSTLAARLPARWIATRRRRRFLFLGLASPGFFAVFGTPSHHQLWLMVMGFLLFAAAVLFRVRTEPLFVRADAADLWPSPSHPAPASKESPHA